MPWPWQKDGLLPLNRRWHTLRARAPKATLRVLVGAVDFGVRLSRRIEQTASIRR